MLTLTLSSDEASGKVPSLSEVASSDAKVGALTFPFTFPTCDGNLVIVALDIVASSSNFIPLSSCGVAYLY